MHQMPISDHCYGLFDNNELIQKRIMQQVKRRTVQSGLFASSGWTKRGKTSFCSVRNKMHWKVFVSGIKEISTSISIKVKIEEMLNCDIPN